jgi:hydroxyacylglutathione hydrolase
MRRFRQLPDYLQVWPAHGAGSACGKGLGAIPSSTVGYEKLFNPALQFDDEQEFVDYILFEQPETPFYFAEMKRVNKEGPELLERLPATEVISPSELAETAAQQVVIDTAPSDEFAESHAPGTINIPASNLVQWAGFFVDYDQPVYLIAEEALISSQLRSLRSIGIDNVGGFFDAAAVQRAKLRTESYESAAPTQLRQKIQQGEATLLDVRAATEFDAGHIAGAEHLFLGKLLRGVDTLSKDKPVVAQCLGGTRSAIAASILQRAGFDVVNMQGGYQAWVAAGLPVSRNAAAAVA